MMFKWRAELQLPQLRVWVIENISPFLIGSNPLANCPEPAIKMEPNLEEVQDILKINDVSTAE